MVGKFRVLSLLGSGGFSTVYAATDLIEDRRVALKIPERQYVDDDDSVADLQREVRLMATLDHPNILPLKEANFFGGHFAMVFPLGDETLGERMGRRISRINAVDLAIQMVAAVAHAHERRILHRDIKPDNFILFPEGIVRLTDFGLARVENRRFAASGSGTLGYIAPEQAMGKPTFRSDVFALGLVMYELFSGEVPEYPFETLPAWNRMRRGLTADFAAIIRKAVDPTPSRRFRDAVAMRAAMLRVRYPLADRTVSFRDAA